MLCEMKGVQSRRERKDNGKKKERPGSVHIDVIPQISGKPQKRVGGCYI